MSMMQNTYYWIDPQRKPIFPQINLKLKLGQPDPVPLDNTPNTLIFIPLLFCCQIRAAKPLLCS